MKIKNGKSILLDETSSSSEVLPPSWGDSSETETTYASNGGDGVRTALAEGDLKPRDIDLEIDEYKETSHKTTLLDGDAGGGFCVGWLLCISGPMKGNSYALKLGRNSIGRGSQNAICLANDDAISREAQVYVVYDNVENEYTVVPGNGSAISRLNNRPIHMFVNLSQGDIITLSNKTSLRFVPACDDTFRWEV